MSATAVTRLWQRMDQVERSLCLHVNRGCRRDSVRSFFVVASRLGDGPAWYALIAMLACVGGQAGALMALRMAVTGALGAAIYKLLKERLVRERPCVSHAGILMGTAPLDRYSFPSGHALHAVSFTTLAVSHDPTLALLLLPLALAIAASRVVLGLHYPTDVAAGAVIGAALAIASLEFWPT
jgi:undecaprenyl-diphosphatase